MWYTHKKTLGKQARKSFETLQMSPDLTTKAAIWKNPIAKTKPKCQNPLGAQKIQKEQTHPSNLLHPFGKLPCMSLCCITFRGGSSSSSSSSNVSSSSQQHRQQENSCNFYNNSKSSSLGLDHKLHLKDPWLSSGHHQIMCLAREEKGKKTETHVWVLSKNPFFQCLTAAAATALYMCEIWEEDFIATAPMWTVVGLEQVVVELSSSSSSSSQEQASKQASVVLHKLIMW